MSRPPKLVMGAVLARCHQAFSGHTCSTMNWALGFRELGWDVWLAEHVTTDELDALEAPGRASPQEEFWKATIEEFGFQDRHCLIVDGKSAELEAFRAFAAEADLFLNYSGQFKRLDLLGPRTRKAYLDVDPGFTQLWVEVCGSDMNFTGHDVFLTVGSTLDRPSVLLPTLGISWIPTLPPVVANVWRERAGLPDRKPDEEAWTTIAHWYGYPELEWQGRKYPGKRESLVELRTLPERCPRACAIATDLAPDWHDYTDFHNAGWRLLRSVEICKDVPTYLRFIAASRGEIGIAKAGYVVSRGGWMSDRSVVYLAMGRPVVAQETGWTQVVPSQPGLLVFRDVEDCAEAIKAVEADYEAHSRAATALAETTFSSQQVIGSLLEKIL